MELSTILIAVPIFFIIYQGVGMFFESRSEKQWIPLSKPDKEDLGQKTLREFTHLSGKVGFNKYILRYEKLNRRLELLLLRSGHPFGWKAENLLFFKELFGIFMCFLLWRFDLGQPLTYLMGFVVGFWLPDLYIQSKVGARQLSIQRMLPGFIDLMALTLEGGLDFLAAVERISDKMRTGDLKDELGMMIQECRLGTPRKEALQHLAFRVNLPDVQSLTSIVIQSEELGTGLASVLRSYAEDMRSKRILRAEDMAGKAPVKLLFPMMVFFFPIVFVIIFGPIALNFMQTK